MYALRRGLPCYASRCTKRWWSRGARGRRISLASTLRFLSSEAVAVTVEWVGHSRRGSQLALPLLMPAFATHLYRYGAANRWKHFSAMSTTLRLLARR